MSEYGLILSSDGSKSFFEIGLWSALYEMGIKLNNVGGAYMGAINAALIAQGNFEKAIDFWNLVIKKDILNINELIARYYTDDWSTQDTKYFKRSFTRFIQSRVNELAPLKDALEKYIDEYQVRQSDIKLSLTTISLNTFENETLLIDDIPKGKLHQYILTSCCYPRIAELSENTSVENLDADSIVDLLIKNGTKDIICMDIRESQNIAANEANPKYVKSSTFDSMNEEFTSNSIKRNILMGYLDTMRAFGGVRGKLYYLGDLSNSNKFKDFVGKLGKNYKGSLGILLQNLLLRHEVSKEAFESRVKRLLKATTLRGEPTSIALLENLANILEIERARKYTYDELLELCIKESKGRFNEIISNLKKGNTLGKLVNTPPTYEEMTKENFLQTFLVLVSTKPDSYYQLRNIFENFPAQGILGVLTLIYLLY